MSSSHKLVAVPSSKMVTTPPSSPPSSPPPSPPFSPPPSSPTVSESEGLDATQHVTADVFKILTQALVRRMNKVEEQTKHDEQKLNELFDLVGLPRHAEDPTENGPNPKLNHDGTLLSIAQLKMAADSFAESLKRMEQECESLMTEAQDLLKAAERVIDLKVGDLAFFAEKLDQLNL